MRNFAGTYIALVGMAALIGGLSAAPSAGAYTFELIISDSALVKQGRELLYRGELDLAVSTYQRALKTSLSNNDEFRANNDLCVAYFFKREFDAALAHCDVAIELGPTKWKSYNNRGSVYLETGDLDAAVADYDKGLKMLPSSTVMAANRSLAMHRASDSKMVSNIESEGYGWTDERNAGERRKIINFASS